MTAFVLALFLATAPDGAANAQSDIATAARLQADCLDPKECRIADEMLAAARAELVAALALADVSQRPKRARGPSDPWEPSDACENPFEDDDPVPDAIEAQAAFELAAVQDGLDLLTKP
jgi:hypothetical protein